MLTFFLTVIVLAVGVLSLLRRRRRQRPLGVVSVRVCLVLGSGGHTAELLRVASRLGAAFAPRLYVLADTDRTSETRLRAAEPSAAVARIGRSREVRQSFASAVASTLRAVATSAPPLLRFGPQLVLCNGPGTCVPVCAVAAALDLVRLIDCRVVFVESVCRVTSLSLSGKLLYHTGIADRLLVQWPDLLQTYAHAEYIGRL